MDFKSKVTELWKKSGSPTWDFEETLKACLDADEFFKARHENPAKVFRKELNNNNDVYVRQWIMGCHFEWLNPR